MELESADPLEPDDEDDPVLEERIITTDDSDTVELDESPEKYPYPPKRVDDSAPDPVEADEVVVSVAEPLDVSDVESLSVELCEDVSESEEELPVELLSVDELSDVVLLPSVLLVVPSSVDELVEVVSLEELSALLELVSALDVVSSVVELS